MLRAGEKMKIGSCDLTKSVFITAEIGANHEGDFEEAKKLIKVAANTGVDAVKFQTYTTEKLVSTYAKELSNWMQKRKKFELTREEFIKLAKVAREEDLIFLSTPYDTEAVDFLDGLVPAFKVSSGDITYSQLIEHVAKKNKPILLSTGMATVDEIWNAIETIKRVNVGLIKRKEVILLHCISSYPTSTEDVNLRSIPFIEQTFDLPVGFSDHLPGIVASQIAVALGARVIEKHFTLNKNKSEFRDHKLSADVGEMKALVNSIRVIEKMLGEYKKEPANKELKNIKLMRRSLAAKKFIPKGTVITKTMLTALRPATGFSPILIDKIVGKKALQDIKKGELLTVEKVRV